jgi:hypothetical protein
MSEQERRQSEKLVSIYKARDEWEGNILIGYLDDNGIEATLQAKVQGAEAGAHAGFGDSDPSCGVFVLEDDSRRATALVAEFEAAVTDDQLLEDAAAEKLKLDKDTIARLRGALRDEKITFEFLGWIGVAFLAAAAGLWAIWPDWLKVSPPAPVLRWSMVILFAVAAMFIGRWSDRRMR